MKQDLPKQVEQWLDWVGRLAWPFRAKRKPEGEGPHYADFSRRLLASTIDSAWIFLLLAPLMQWLSLHLLGHVDVEAVVDGILAPYRKRGLPLTPEDREIIAATIVDTLHQLGFWRQWLLSNALQIGLIGLCVVPCWARFGTTPGKYLLRLRVQDADSGKKPTIKQATIRFLGYIPAALPLLFGLFWIAWDKRHQGWHDKLANTVVTVRSRGKA